MSTETKSNSAMAFVLGAVVVVLGGLVWYISTGGQMPGQDQADIKIELPNVKIDK